MLPPSPTAPDRSAFVSFCLVGTQQPFSFQSFLKIFSIASPRCEGSECWWADEWQCLKVMMLLLWVRLRRSIAALQRFRRLAAIDATLVQVTQVSVCCIAVLVDLGIALSSLCNYVTMLQEDETRKMPTVFTIGSDEQEHAHIRNG